MKSLYCSLVVACALLAGAAIPAQAGENSGAKILVHIGSPTTKNVCTSEVPADCRDAVVSAPSGNFYNIYVCIGNQSDSVGVAGVQFGIMYDPVIGSGVDIFSWTRCGDMEFAMDGWPGYNTGTIVTWVRTFNCQYGPQTTVAGYFYVGVYSPDRFSLIPRPVDAAAKVADCNASETDLTSVLPSPLGYADFGTGDGYNPCTNIVPTQPTTWSGVKSLFR
jgi:hypothetical protein